MLSIGLMSGTSMDGIDAALLETDGTAQHIKEIGHLSVPYSSHFKILLKAAEWAIRQSGGELSLANAQYEQALQEYAIDELHYSAQDFPAKRDQWAATLYGEEEAHRLLTFDAVVEHSTLLHAQAVNSLLKEVNHVASQIDVVGYHGQCLLHQPAQKISVIVGDGQALADHVGITVVNDFRRRDIAAGGQGAPFAPLYHQALAIRDNKMSVAVLNCGGIANITLINGPHENDLIAYDTGPGNGLIDRLVRQRTLGLEHMDLNGQYGLQGAVNEAVLEALFQRSIIKDGKNYFTVLPPKSLDSGDLDLIPELSALSLEDACATLEAFTARSIVQSLDLLNTEGPGHWILAGGGWNNPVIYRELVSALKRKIGPHVIIENADEAGWNTQAMEAQIFAYLAVRSLQNQPLSVPGTTGVPLPLSGGHAHLPKIGPTPAVEVLGVKS